MNGKASKQKGTRAEGRARRILTTAGYSVIRAGGSLGCFDLVALGSQDVRAVQVKAGQAYASGVEKEAMRLAVLPPNATREVWRFPDFCRRPLIEVL